MIVLFRKIGTLRAASALASWMFRIVRNECLRRVRALARRDEPRFEEPTPSAEDDVLNKLEIERVAAVAALPNDQRRVLIMRDVQGLPGSTVAKMVGLSTAGMKSRLHRARSAVRNQLSIPNNGTPQ